MKLVIQTQICENYGAHNWDGEGECPDNWKFKGGNTYVVDNITPSQKARLEREGIPTLSALIEENNDYCREYILGAQVVGDAEMEGEPWEIPFRLSYVGGRWVARRVIDNLGEYGGYCRREIKTKIESYIMAEGGRREDFAARYVLVNGAVATNEDDLRLELEMMEDA